MASAPPVKKTKRVAVTSDFHHTKWTYASRKGADAGSIVHKELELWCKWRIEPKTEVGKRGLSVLRSKGFEGRDGEIHLVSPIGAKYPRKGRIDLLGTLGDNSHFMVEIKTTLQSHSIASSKYKVEFIDPLQQQKYFPCFGRVMPNTLFTEHRAQLLAYMQFYAHKKKMPAGVPLQGAVLFLTADSYLWEPVSQVYEPFAYANELREDIKERKAAAAIAREQKKAAAKKEREKAKKCKGAAVAAVVVSASKAKPAAKETGTRKRKSEPKASPSSKRSRSSSAA
jgi:hypothetical protein